MLPLDQIAPFAAIVCLAIFTQSATGFAAGLVVMPLMVWVGHGIPEAQAALLVSTIPQNGWGVYQYHHTVRFKDLVLPASLRLAALPVGVGALYLVDDFPVQFARQTVGVVVIMCVLLLVLFRPKPSSHVHPAWAWIAFPVSGFFQGCTGTGGPMMVLWVQAHDWSTKKTRAFLFVMYLVSIIPAWGLLYFYFGNRITVTSMTALVLIPLLLVATWVGLRAGTWLGRERLRRVTIALLLVIGVVSVCSPMLSSSQAVDEQSDARDDNVAMACGRHLPIVSD